MKQPFDDFGFTTLTLGDLFTDPDDDGDDGVSLWKVILGTVVVLAIFVGIVWLTS